MIQRSPVWLRLAAVASILAALVVAGVSASPAQSRPSTGNGSTTGAFQQGNPPGNNGTIKVDNAPFDNDPDNEPHVDCTFQIDFYGYDQGKLNATYTFELQSPTRSPIGRNTLRTGSVFIGEDPAGGGTDLDASVTVNLSNALTASGATPQANQGYHVKLTINADGSQGADTKHKVFWVRPCGTTTTTTTTTGTTTTGTTTTGTTTTGTTTTGTTTRHTTTTCTCTTTRHTTTRHTTTRHTTTTGTTTRHTTTTGTTTTGTTTTGTTTTGTTTAGMTTTHTTTTSAQPVTLPDTGSTTPYGILFFSALIVGASGFALRRFQRRKA